MLSLRGQGQRCFALCDGHMLCFLANVLLKPAYGVRLFPGWERHMSFVTRGQNIRNKMITREETRTTT